MKLHLPVSLRSALLACLGLVLTLGSGQAAEESTYVLQATGSNALLQAFEKTGETVSNTAIALDTLTANDTVLLELETGTTTLAGWIPTNFYAKLLLGNNTLNINNGSSDKTYTFHSAITGGTSSVIAKPTNTAADRLSFTFDGDMSAFRGTLDLDDTTEVTYVTFSNYQGTSANSCTIHEDARIDANKLIFTTDYSVNGTVTANSLSLAGDVTFSNNVTVAGNITGTSGTATVAGGTFSGTLTSGTLRMNGGSLGNFTLNGGTLDLGSASNGTLLPLGGTGTITLTSGNVKLAGLTSLSAGDYTLATTEGSLTMADGALSFNRRQLDSQNTFLYTNQGQFYTGTLSVSGSNTLSLNVTTYTGDVLDWNNSTDTWSATDSGSWDGGTFSTGSVVRFANDGTEQTVTIGDAVQPAYMLISSGSTYTFNTGDSGSLSGTGTLEVGGSATINGTHSAWGGYTEVADGGSLTIQGGSTLLNNLSVLSGGTLNITINSSSTNTKFVQEGEGDVHITIASGQTWTLEDGSCTSLVANERSGSTFSGDILVDGGGTLQLGNSASNASTYTISPNVLGSTGSITLQDAGTTLALRVSGKGASTFSRSIVLNEGTKLDIDGQHTLSSVQVAKGAAATLEYRNKNASVTVVSLTSELDDDSAPTGKLTITHSDNGGGVLNLTGTISLKELVLDGTRTTTIISGSNVTIGTLTVGVDMESGNTTIPPTKLSHADIQIDTLNVNKGITELTLGGSNYAGIKQVNIANGAVFRMGAAGSRADNADITIAGGGKLRLDNGSSSTTTLGTSSKYITIDATSAEAPAIIAAGVNGYLKVQNIIQGKGYLELRRSEQNYDNAVYLTSGIHDHEGALAVTQTSGQYFLQAAGTYSGGTTIDSSVSTTRLVVAADDALGSGDVTLKQGKLEVSSSHSLKNTINFGSAETPVATLAKKGTEATATVSYNNVRLTEGGIEASGSTNGSIAGATITVKDTSATDFALSGVTATDCEFNVNAALRLEAETRVGDGSVVHISSTGSLLGDNTAILAGSGHTLAVDLSDGSSLVAVESTDAQFYNLTYQQVASTQLSGITGDEATITVSLSGAQVEAWTAEGKDIFLVFKAPTAPASLYALETASTFSADSSNGITFQLDDTLTNLGYQVGTYETQYLSTTLNSGEIGIYLTTQQRTETQVIPEPATATLSLLALTALAARRRRS